MRVRKKRIATLALATCLALLAFTFALALPSSALAWDNCPKGLVNDPYPGACRRYVDTNGDGICDLSQPEPQQVTTTTTEVVKQEQTATTTSLAVATTTAGDPPTGDCPLGPCANCGACLGIGSSLSAAASSDLVYSDSGTGAAGAVAAGAVALAAADSSTSTTTPGSGGSTAADDPTIAAGSGDTGGFSLFTHYNVSPIAIAFFLIYAVSFVLHKTKRIRLATHRKVWNVLLAATFLITGIFGLILTIQLDYELPFTIPFDLLFWHVEAGVVMTLISLFHLGWHFNYYKNLVRSSRKKVRAAREMEKLRDAEERRLAWEARAARRATAAGGSRAQRRRPQTEAARETAYRNPGIEPERARTQTCDTLETEL